MGTGRVTILAGQTSGTIRLNTLAGNITDPSGRETVTVKLDSIISGAATIGIPASAQAATSDNRVKASDSAVDLRGIIGEAGASAGAWGELIDATNLGATGYQFGPITVGGARSDQVSALLALHANGIDGDARIVQLPTSGDLSVNVGFHPKAVIMFATNGVAALGTEDNAFTTSIGCFTEDAAMCVSCSELHGVGPSDTANLVSAVNGLLLTDNSTARNVIAQANSVTFDPTGFTIPFVVQPTGAFNALVIAIPRG